MPLEKAIGKAIIRSLAGTDMSISRIISTARSVGGTYRRQDMLNDIRVTREKVKYQDAVSRLDPGRSIPRGYMVENDLDRPYNYRVFGEAEIYDEDAGEYYTKKVSWYTDDLLSKGDMESEFISGFHGLYAEEDQSLTGVNVIGIEHNRGLHY